MYTPVDSRVWNDEKFVRFTPFAQLLFLYLLTSPHRNILGLYYLPRGYVAEDVRLSEKDSAKAWSEVIESGRIDYDEQARVVFVPNFLRYNPIRGSKSMTGAVNKFAEIPSTRLAKNLLEVITKHYDNEEAMPLISAIRQRIGNETSPNNTPSKPHDMPHGSSVTVTVTEAVTVTETPPSPASGEVVDVHTERFDEFWAMYPKKKSKARAKKAWDKIKPSRAAFEKIKFTLAKMKNSRAWVKDGGQYIPHPATWLNDGGWDDEPDAMPWEGRNLTPTEKVALRFAAEEYTADAEATRGIECYDQG